MSHRWPVHPAPSEGEALTAWLIRVANCYEMDLRELLLYEWGQADLPDLDSRPPDGFLEMIAERSGFELAELHCMTMAGWMPWLFDSFDFEDDAFTCYTSQFSVLLPPRPHATRSVSAWRGWLPKQKLNRFCPACFGSDFGGSRLKLAWQFPLMISCPKHGCRLESFFYYPGQFSNLDNMEIVRLPASFTVVEMDRLTEQAFTTGQVNLPGRNVHAGYGFVFYAPSLRD